MSQGNESDQCQYYSDKNPDPTNSEVAMTLFAIVYTHIFVLGLIGNLSIMFLTLRYHHLRTVQNIFILNLAISDVIVCLLSLPFTPVTSIYKVWMFGQPICHLLPLVQAVSIFVSTFSLSAIAIDRYNLVVRPHARPLTIHGARNVAVVLWVLSVVVSLPYAYYMRLETYEELCGQFCTEIWPSKSMQRSYALVVLIMQFLLPFVTMSFCYSTIFSKLRERANSKLKKLDERSQLLNIHQALDKKDSVKLKNGDDTQRANLLAQQRRTTTILASMVLIFGLTWLPQNIVTLMLEYDDEIFSHGAKNYTYLVSMIAHSIAMLTNVANPVLYAWLNPTFKQLFLQFFTNKKLPESADASARIAAPKPSGVQTARESVAKLSGLDEADPKDNV
uniref:G_PROTEIN_RECEP_F1_2 domain-containing protein n=2 Tax=Bursaphelenchus xylophilus TaxID=6326 RepID=A0A1I7RIM2_BURXY